MNRPKESNQSIKQRINRVETTYGRRVPLAEMHSQEIHSKPIAIASASHKLHKSASDELHNINLVTELGPKFRSRSCGFAVTPENATSSEFRIAALKATYHKWAAIGDELRQISDQFEESRLKRVEPGGQIPGQAQRMQLCSDTGATEARRNISSWIKLLLVIYLCARMSC